MIAIDNILVSDEIIQEHFVCDLAKCKGACCADGDAGAPLLEEELDTLAEAYPFVEPYLTEDGKSVIQSAGKYVYDRHFGWVTPVIRGEMCAYGMIDANGIIKCGIEQAFNDAKLAWKKPISCHLFPIRVSSTSSDEKILMLNYEPRPDNCKPACKLGKSLRLPVFRFLKEAIVRKFGNEFFHALESAYTHFNTQK